MERRLKLAKQLLNPDDSVLIVTIDEKEVHRLGLLIEQTFRDEVQMVTSVINPKGSARSGRFSRVDEYLNVVMIGRAQVHPWMSDMLRPVTSTSRQVRWAGLMRQGEGSRRTRIPSMFFPIFIDADSGTFHSVGQPPPRDADRAEIAAPQGTVGLWPVDGNGNEMMWRLNPASVVEYAKAGYLKFGRRDPETATRPVLYLQQGILDAIKSGDVRVQGRDAEGAVILEFADHMGTRRPTTTWNMTSHSASEHGAGVLKALIPGRRFPYPKSIYAVEDTIRFFVKDKSEALVLDFFGGSGTTTHAIARLNRQDGGQRQSILVTNNEVSADESDALRKKGLRPGDPQWESLGIFEHITRPRIEAAITGRIPEGEPIKGDYRFTDEFPMSEGFVENVEFLELTYLDPDDVELDTAFDAIARLLWLRAGARGPVIKERQAENGARKAFEWTESYGVLFNTDRWRAFVNERPQAAITAFIVTDSPSLFTGISAELPGSMDVVRLYENYLSTFAINEGHT